MSDFKRTIAARKFLMNYGLELLPYSHRDLMLGDLMDKNIIQPTWFYLNKNIINFLFPDKEERIAFRAELEAIEKIPAGFPNIIMDKDFMHGGKVTLPGLNVDLSSKIDINSFVKMEFDGVYCKILQGETRIALDEKLEVLKEQQFKKYREEIRGVFVIEGLFYVSSVKIEVKKSTTANIGVSVPVPGVGDIQVSTDNTANNHTIYELKNLNCPFAVDLVRGRDF